MNRQYCLIFFLTTTDPVNDTDPAKMHGLKQSSGSSSSTKALRRIPFFQQQLLLALFAEVAAFTIERQTDSNGMPCFMTVVTLFLWLWTWWTTFSLLGLKFSIFLCMLTVGFFTFTHTNALVGQGKFLQQNFSLLQGGYILFIQMQHSLL